MINFISIVAVIWTVLHFHTLSSKELSNSYDPDLKGSYSAYQAEMVEDGIWPESE